MFVIKNTTYETRNSQKDTFSLLELGVEKVDRLGDATLGFRTADSNKPWVGKYEKSVGAFKILQTNPHVLPFRFLEGNFFTVFVYGTVTSNTSKSKIQLRFGLSWQTFIFWLLVCLLASSFIITSLFDQDWESLWHIIVGCVLIIIIPMLLLKFQLGRTEKGVLNLLGVR